MNITIEELNRMTEILEYYKKEALEKAKKASREGKEHTHEEAIYTRNAMSAVITALEYAKDELK